MKIVILSTQRSGSTLVCDDFLGTKKLGRPTEHYLGVWNKSSQQEIGDYFKNKATSQNGVRSVKIMANQLRKIDQLYENLGSHSYRLPFFRINKKNPYKFLFEEYKNAAFFRVYREDKVAQAVSLIFSERTDVFHLVENTEKLKGIVGKETNDQSIKEVSFEYDRAEIDKRLHFIKNNETILDEFCKYYKIKPTIIKYEDIISGNGYIVDIAKSLGVNDVMPSKRTLKKIGGSNSKYWIDRYKSGE